MSERKAPGGLVSAVGHRLVDETSWGRSAVAYGVAEAVRDVERAMTFPVSAASFTVDLRKA